MDRLLVAVVGNQNSGESKTWYKMFRSRVRTGIRERDLPLCNGESTHGTKTINEGIDITSCVTFE